MNNNLFNRKGFKNTKIFSIKQFWILSDDKLIGLMSFKFLSNEKPSIHLFNLNKIKINIFIKIVNIEKASLTLTEKKKLIFKS